MKTAHAKLESITAYSQSRQHDEPKLEKETWDDYEKRTWRSKAHANNDGQIIIPPMAFKMSVDACAKRLSIPIPGAGKKTYTKSFLSGVLVTEPILTAFEAATINGEWINANADGVRGSGKRVKRCYPVLPSWSGIVVFFVLDDQITKPVFERVLAEAGRFVGIGRFRPENGGFYGRFDVKEVHWTEE